MPRVKDLRGNKYNKLTVISENGRAPGGNVLWKCICEVRKRRNGG